MPGYSSTDILEPARMADFWGYGKHGRRASQCYRIHHPRKTSYPSRQNPTHRHRRLPPRRTQFGIMNKKTGNSFTVPFLFSCFGNIFIRVQMGDGAPTVEG